MYGNILKKYKVIMENKVFYGGEHKLTGNLILNKPLFQTFEAIEEELLNFGVMFATYKKKYIQSIIKISILSQDGERIFSSDYYGDSFIDNQYLSINLPKIKLKKGNEYILKIECIKYEQNSPITCKYGTRKHPNELFCINSEPKRGELCCYFIYRKQQQLRPTPISHDIHVSGLISIIIPVYNSCKFLKPLLNDIMAQTYNNLQVIIIDDGSKDVEDVYNLAIYYKNKMNLVFAQLDKNHGAPFARNTGFKYAVGEFLFFCDSDVQLKPHAMQSMIQSLHDHKEAAWTYCNFTWGKNKLNFYPFSKQKLFQNNCSSTMSMVRSEVFPGFDEALPKYQDWDLWIRLAKEDYIGTWINDTLFHAVERPGITSRMTRKEGLIILKRKHPEIRGF